MGDELDEWVRTSGEHDAVVDFERALADPRAPDALAPEHDSGDLWHPNDAGYQAMAEVVSPFDLRGRERWWARNTSDG